MGLLISQPVATDRPGPTGRMIPPVPEGAVYGNFFGGLADIHTRNLVPGGAPATMIGTVAAGATSARFTPGSHYLRLPVTHSAQGWTMLLVAKPVADTAPAPGMGNQNTAWQGQSGATGGVALYFESGTSGDGNVTPTFAVATDNADDPRTTTARVISAPARALSAMPDCIIATYDDAAGVKKIRNMTTGQVAVAAAVELDQALGQPLYLGHSGNPTYHSGQLDGYAAWIWKYTMTDPEADSVHAWIKACMASWYEVPV